jgi:formylglycine-generating enzyme
MFGYSSPVRSSYSVLVAAVLAGLLASTASAAPGPVVNMEMVPVGYAGNAPDTTGYGAVNYDYHIGKYDVTAGQYTVFLNAVASTGDPYGLYNPFMNNGQASCGITQTPDGLGGYSYAAVKGPNLPVNFVSFWNAARFVNWLQNGQPVGAEGPTTTEDGSYTITADGIAANSIVRNPAATWVISSQNEWYKAAYFDPALAGGTGGYWQYPTRSNVAPSNSPVDAGNNANYYVSGTYTNSPLYLTPVGTFANSHSAFDTFDQGGDVTQWNDTVINAEYRGIRGGSWSSTSASLKSSGRDYTTPAYADGLIGFRVVLVPEPASLSILVLGASGLLAWRRRKA